MIGLKAKLSSAVTCSSAKLVALIVARFGLISAYESLKGANVSMVFFDVDGKTGETTAEALLEAALKGVETFFGFMPARVVIAESHGGDKLSFRLYVPGYKMVISDIKKRLVRLGLDKNRPFDGAVYGSQQKLRTLGSYKTETDRRVLKLVNLELNHDNILSTIVQHVEDSWPLLEEPASNQKDDKPLQQERQQQIVEEIVEEPLHSDLPLPVAKKGRPSTDSAEKDEVVAILQSAGFDVVKLQLTTAPGMCYTLDASRRTRDCCPCCKETHDGNMWCVHVNDTNIVVRNHSDRCTSLKLDRPGKSTALAVAHPAKRGRGRPPKDQTIEPAVCTILQAMGFVQPQHVGSTAEGFNFTAGNRDRCPNCSNNHATDNWWCIPKVDTILVGNYSTLCQSKSFPRSSSATAEAITPIAGDFQTTVAALDLEPAERDKLTNACLHYHRSVVDFACNKPECLACTRMHANSGYTCHQIIPHHCWTLRNNDNSCPGRIFHHSAGLSDKLAGFFSGPPSDETLCNLFMEGNSATLHFEGGTMYQWRDGQEGQERWQSLSSNTFMAFVSWWLNTLLRGISGIPDFQEYNKHVAKLVERARGGNLKLLRQLIEGRIEMQTGKRHMDQDPYLLGCENGVIELRAPAEGGGYTTRFRLARPEDLITKSVGYEIPAKFGECSAVEEVFAQIYPVEEERRFFQLFGGYCLLGKAPAKGFLCLTDRRKGDNGKSTAVRLLRKAIGDDYVIENKQNLLYESRFAPGPSGHDSGLIAFEGKRLALMEELSSSRALDTSFLKQVAGGESTISVRAANSAVTRAMHWSATIITVFNEGCAPRFKVEDDAFVNRMIVLPHRTLFCKTDEIWAAHKHEQHTFQADGGKVDRLQPHQVLAWFLEGLVQYWGTNQMEFNPPVSCREWAGALVEEQDGLRAWLEEHVRVGDSTDFIVRKDLESAVRAAQIDIKPLRLKRRIESLYASVGVRCKVDHFSEGRKYASVWVGLKWTA